MYQTRWSRFIITASAVAITACIVITILLYILTLFPWVQRSLCSQLSKIIGNATHSHFSVKKVQYFFPSTIYLHDVKINDTTALGGEILIKFVKARLSLAKLLKKTIHVSTIALQQGQIEYHRDSTGEFSFLEPLLKHISSGTKSSWSLSIKEAALQKIDILYIDRRLNFEAGLNLLGSRIVFQRLDSLAIHLESSGGFMRSPWWSGNIDLINVSAELGRKGILIKTAHFRGPEDMVDGKGYIAFSTQRPWDILVHTSAAVKNISILSRVLPGLEPSCQATVSVSFKGTFDRPLIDVAFKAYKIRWQSITFDSLNVSAFYDSNSILKATLWGQSSSYQTSIYASITLPKLLSAPTVGRYFIKGKADRIDIEHVMKLLGVRRYQAGGTGAVAFEIENEGANIVPTRADIVARIGGCKGPGGVLDSISAHIFLENSKWKLQFALGQNALDATGTLSDKNVFLGNFNGKIPDPAQIVKLISNENLGGTLAISGSINGTLEKPYFEVGLQGNLAWREIVADTLFGLIELSREGYFFKNFHSLLRGKLLPVFDYFGFKNIDGFFTAAVDFEGSTKQPKLKASLHLDSLFTPWLIADSVTASVTYKNDTFSVISLEACRDSVRLLGTGWAAMAPFSGFFAQCNLFKGSSKINGRDGGTVSCKASLTTGGGIDMNLVADKVALEVASKIIPKNFLIRGEFSGQVGMSGALDNPTAMAEATLVNAGINKQNIGNIEVKAQLRDSLFAGIAKATVFGGQSLVNIKFRCPLSPKNKWKIVSNDSEKLLIEADANSFTLSELNSLLFIPVGLDGKADAALVLELVEDRWQTRGTLKISDAVLRLIDKNIQIYGIGSAVSFSGPVDGVQIRFETEAEKATISGLQTEQIKIRGMADSKGITFNNAQLFVSGGVMTADGYLPFGKLNTVLNNPALKFKINIDNVPVVLFKPYFTTIDIGGGIINGKASASVHDGKPDLSGYFQLREGNFSAYKQAIVCSPIEASVEFRDDTVVVKEVVGMCGGGRFNGRGRMILSKGNVSNMSFYLNTTAIGLFFPGERLNRGQLNMKITSAELELKDRGNDYFLTGAVSLGKTSYIRDIGVRDLVDLIENVLYGRESSKRETESFVNKIKFDININTTDNTTLDMNLGKLDIHGRLKITGTPYMLGLTGEMEISSGVIYYLDRKFTVEKGVFRQYESDKLNPEINLHAYSSGVRDLLSGNSYTIELKLSGYLRHPELELTARNKDGEQVLMSREDIISLLTFGHFSSQLGTMLTHGTMENGMSHRGMAIATGVLSHVVNRSVSDWLSLEHIAIEGNLGNLFKNKKDQMLEEPSLTVEKKVTRRLNVTYRTSIGNFNDQRIKLSYNLFKFLYIDGESNQNGKEAGIDLQLKYAK